MLRLLHAAPLAAALLAAPAAAHEFWLEPHAYGVEAGAPIAAALRVGQMFDGQEIPYRASRARQFTLSDGVETRTYQGEGGAKPALSDAAGGEGLLIVAYESAFSRVVFEEWERFTGYLRKEGAAWAIEAHLEAGLSEDRIVEYYARCAKTLIQVGPFDPAATDSPQGLTLELVALENPYRPGLETLPAQLLWRGEPAADIQIAIFHKLGEGESAPRETVRTDADGRVEIPLSPGERYLLSAVRLEQADPASGGQWRSHWASLTFETPAH